MNLDTLVSVFAIAALLAVVTLGSIGLMFLVLPAQAFARVHGV